ncbi:MAG: GNAT family N-acetyltransferase [Moorea sp. SIOASIH]|uniref:GNAT family N-acetyltransferase n=1 Tax=Moorena TaxID=1155738 RepID=UPI0013BBB312|nr:GNAT family N-acetyltransferase [Moorena sp. SIOASIH]NEO38405.1 GNAT family N-acetyltransferase [Moorena sp. SIOASIH]NEO89612.1 GNAT family N-acetyltransferase [Moorena sp. SIO3G5]
MSEVTIRPACLADVEVLFNLIQALVESQKASHTVTGNIEDLKEHLFGPRIYAEAILAQRDDKAVGFALFFYNYSTFMIKPVMYLGDLFVLPEYRRQGIAKALIRYLAKLAISRDCGRLELSVLDWNSSAIAFYKSLGASILDEWRICHITGTSLTNLGN